MAYSLSQSYFGANLISDFNFINYPDPSNGFVRYQSQPDALAKGLYFIDPDTQAVTLGVDNKNTYNLSDGRPSLRLESKEQYNHGLFIGDFAHMPPSVCGLWPAFWMYGPDWPTSGEIDIIEGANQATKNIISGHSTSGCRIPDDPAAAGQPLLLNCESPGTTNNAGCNYLPPASDMHTYGDSFNAVGGGVYALEWTSEAISIWHWPRQSIPEDIVAKNPDPSGWGLPTALFGTSTCNVDTYFKDMSIVIQTNFCGDYAGNIWGQDGDTCNQRAPTCVEYVANNPTAFANAYWEVNYIDVYEQGLVANNTGPAEPTTTTTIKSTSTIYTTVPNPATIVTSITQNGTVLVSTTTVQSQPQSSVVLSTVVGPTATAPPSPSTDPLVPEREPATIGEYAYLGCFGSATGFQTFSPKASAADMTLENECFCADNLDPDTRATADRALCNSPCPGNNTELCGGTTTTNTNTSGSTAGIALATSPSRRLMHLHLHRRAAPATYLLTVYGRLAAEVPPNAPPLGDPEPHAPSTSTLVTTVTYTTVCATDAARLTPAEHSTTILVLECNKYCGDGQPAAVSVPMTTTVASCAGCGADGADRVTLTVPFLIFAVPVTASGTATGYWPTSGGGGGSATAAVTPPAGGGPTGGPTPSMVSVSAASASEVNFTWAVGLGVAIALVRFALMFF
ncbi:mixed-linked glucanase [Colletotrichum orchidophilum]|uniref:Mixed-linked glucanase n=1 Tax=Colletotrichum orchidophilum TaxID=1209926 RepID=A0A1G4BBX3_9PEZI|nr:mixed-linked glucanase [Colletotrichum orchidophilum]OHE98845.1 mixed-linked glucanase [Colletotrichum orchidophilum]